MKTLFAAVVSAVALLGTACGPGPGDSEMMTGQRVELRMAAADAADFDQFVIPLAKVRVRSGERDLPVRMEPGQLELATPGHAPLMARVWIPDGTEEVSVRVWFDEYGAYSRRGEAQWFRIGAPLAFHAKVADLVQRDHAVVQVNLSRSLVAGGPEAMLLPSLDVRY